MIKDEDGILLLLVALIAMASMFYLAVYDIEKQDAQPPTRPVWERRPNPPSTP